MPFVEGGIVVDAEPQQQAAPTATQGGFVQGGIEVDPTPEDSYNKVLQYQAAQTDYTPTKQEYLDYLKVSKTKPLLGERPLETVLTAAGQTAVDIAKMPYRLGEAIGQYLEPPEGVMPMDVAAGTAAEIAIQSRLKAEAMARGGYDVALSNLEKLTGKLRSDDDRYKAFLATSEIKRELARANAPEDQRVPAAQEFLQAYNIPQEAISQPGLEVGGFLADPSSIAFAGGGKAASALLQRAAPLIPRAGAALQRGGERITAIGQAPEAGAGALTTAVTGSPAMGQAVQEAISKGTTGVALGEAAGLPITATMNVPGLGTVSRVIGGTKAAGATMETLGEAGAISGGQTLTPIQRGLLGAGERIAAAEGASAGARAFGTALARSGIEAPAIGAAKILIPTVGAGVGGGLLAGLTGEEGDAIAAAIGSGFAFGAIDSGFRLAKAASSDALNANRVRRTAVDDLNTRPTEVQFTYIDPTTGSEQLSTIKDAESRAKLYASLDNKQLTKALSEVAGAEAGGAEVIFHGNADAVPASLQGIDYAGVAIGPNNIKSGKTTILINVDRAKPETLPHEILHAKITSDVLSQLGSQVIESSVQSPEFQKQFTDFANRYADKLDASGAKVTADRIRTELRDAFDPTQQRAQRIENLKRMTDEFAAYYTQEFLKGKDPKTLLPGRIPSFFELAFNNAKEAVAERFTRQALQNGFDPVARTFYDANGKRIKIPWMEDAIKNLISPKEGFEPTEQKVDTRKMTQAQQNALIMARGYSDLFMTAPDGSIVRPLTKAELAAKTADVANRTMKVIETVPQNERTSVSGLDANGNPVIDGRLSLAEADALSKSGIFSPSTSRYIVDIATAIRDGTLMEGRYWKVYGPTGKSGVFGESEKLFLPYGISINSKGGVNVKAVDWGKVQARMYKALTKPAYKNLFRTYDQAMSTLKDVYLKNIAEQNAVPSADALGGGIEGAKKRNFFNEVMGAVPKKGDVMINLPTAGYEAGRKGGSVYQDLRIERIQNANLTGNKIPWSGDMGEQSSYRRTQLNFQPAETIGETQVSTDQNGGYRILSKNGKFRLYGPDGSTVGIFDTEGQAKLKAEKDYATQARLQPEVRQQQYPARDEGRQTAEAGRGDRALGRTQGREEGRQELGAVRQEGDVNTRFMPDQQGFYSKLEEVVNAKLPKVASPQQVLASVDPAKGSGVKPEELKWTGFTQAVERIAKENGGKVPKEKLIEHLKNEGRVRFEEVTTGIQGKSITQEEVDRLMRRAQRTQANADWRAYEDAVLRFESQELGTEAQYSKYQLPGGENYREVVLISDTAAPYTSSHFQDIPNYVAHMRVNERADASGKPGLFVEEIQSDRHQQAREKGYAQTKEQMQARINELLAIPAKDRTFNQDDEITTLSSNISSISGGQTGIPDAPFRKDWSLQMFKRALRDAVASGKEWIGWTTGETQADRYDLSKQIKTLSVEPLKDVTGKFAVYANGNLMQHASRDTLSDVVGKEMAQKALSDIDAGKAASYSGLDLKIGGEGMKGFYDKILPSEIQKYVKQWGSEVKKSEVNTGQGKPTEYSDFSEYQKARKEGQKTTIWRVDITPEMRKSVETVGQPRFMPSDTAYLSAVQKGDTQAAQRMVDEAAKAAGYTVGPVYHGTPTGGFNVFDKRMRGETSGVSREAFSFTTNQKAAENYSKRLGDEAVRLDAGLRVANDAMRKFDDDVAAQEYFSSKGYTSVEDGMLPEFDWGSIEDVPEFIKELRGYAKDLKPINPDLASSFVEAAKVMSSTKAVPEVKRVFLRIPENAPVFQATPSTLGMVMRDFSAEREPTKAGIVELPGNERIYYVADSSQVKLADPVTKDAQGNVIPLSKRFQASSEDIRFMPDYSGEHRAPGRDSGAPLDNLKGVYPDDVYGPNAARYYGHESGSQTDKAAVRIIQATKGKPDAPVKVFRAIPKSIQSNEINPGDWITTIKSYAVQHGEGPLGGDYKILEKTVPAGDLYTDGNSIFEFGYDPKFMPQPDSSMPGAYSFQGGYRALPGKAKGSLRLYGPAGSLIGIAASLDEAQRIIRRKTRP